MQETLSLPDEYAEQESAVGWESDPGVPAVELRGFGVAYDGNVVLCDAQAVIRHGEITAVLGPSGSGKTSLVNALLGLVDYSGELRVFGAEARGIRPDELRRRIAYSPEHGQLFGEDSVLENLRYAAPESTEDEVRRVCARLSLDGVELTRPADALSGGQRLRVSLARALLRDAEIVILDEPTAVLTPQETEELFDRLIGLKKKGMTIIFISHKLNEVMAISDRVTVLRRGHAVGTVETAEMDVPTLTEMIVGRSVSLEIHRSPVKDPEDRLRVVNLTCLGSEGHKVLDDVSFTLRSGEN